MDYPNKAPNVKEEPEGGPIFQPQQVPFYQENADIQGNYPQEKPLVNAQISGHLQAVMDRHIIRCPRYWNVPISPLQGESLEDNYKRMFQPYMPNFLILEVIPMDYKRKPRCSFVVRFHHFLPVAGGSKRRIMDILNTHKPRNTTIADVWSERHGLNYFVVRYRIYCPCNTLDFCNIDKAQWLDHLKSLKLERN